MATDATAISATTPGGAPQWSRITGHVDTVGQSGHDIDNFTSLMRLMLDDFIHSFDSLTDPKVIVDLWTKLAQLKRGSGPFYLSGRISLYCITQADGSCVYTRPQGPVEIEVLGWNDPSCELEGMAYHRAEVGIVPNLFVSVPVRMDRSGAIFRLRMVAGLVGIQVSNSDLVHCGPGSYQVGSDGWVIPTTSLPQGNPKSEIDSVHPLSVRWMFELREGIEDVSDHIEAAHCGIDTDELVQKLEEIFRDSLTLNEYTGLEMPALA
ncbi:Uu.00g064090.m01.CDS01 [Anthostomella pinea]|uniref:Uu.00g064090.m01.CDS01 n=1 Tax=Anthostomella pinea TaxID=933095 RepID=A0AAI8VU94_9PEZI|nr:Uu.00g064090.m01.CDS01 [Anthostomella pinea]